MDDRTDEEKIRLRKLKKMRYKANKQKKWFDGSQNHNFIYVEGLPQDIT